jgi:LysM repeat protein
MRTWIPVLMLLLLGAAGCSGGGDEPLPTAAPTVARARAQEAADGDSPRVTPPAESGVPPTWTPAPRATPPPALATRTPEGGAAPRVGVSEGLVYEVAAGDTLAAIADRFDVDVETLATVNGITNADTIEVGQFILIPR